MEEGEQGEEEDARGPRLPPRAARWLWRTPPRSELRRRTDRAPAARGPAEAKRGGGGTGRDGAAQIATEQWRGGRDRGVCLCTPAALGNGVWKTISTWHKDLVFCLRSQSTLPLRGQAALMNELSRVECIYSTTLRIPPTSLVRGTFLEGVISNKSTVLA